MCKKYHFEVWKWYFGWWTIRAFNSREIAFKVVGKLGFNVI